MGLSLQGCVEKDEKTIGVVFVRFVDEVKVGRLAAAVDEW